MAVVSCPSCGQQLNVPEDMTGKTVRCPKCAGTFTSEPPSSAPPPPPARDRDRADEYDDDDYERERPARGYGAPHRGGLVMGMGIGSLVIVLASYGMWAVVGPFGTALNLVGLILGILGWIWGSADLKKMQASTMDASGRGNTQAGYICGIIGTVLNGLTLLCGCLIGIVIVAFFGAMFTAAASAPPPPAAKPVSAPAPPQAPKPMKSIVVPLPKLSNYLPSPRS